MHNALLKFAALLLSILISGCQNGKEGTRGTTGSIEQDTIISWIERVKDSGIPPQDRRDLLLQTADYDISKKNDTFKTRFYSRLSLAFLQLADSSSFREANRQTLQNAASIRDTITLAEAHWDLAQFFGINNVPDSAYYHYSEASGLFSIVGDKYGSARMLYNMAVIQAEVKDYTGSEINTIKAIELLKPLNQNLQLYNCYTNLGSITKELGDYERAIGYYEQAGEYLDEIDEKNILRYSLDNNLGVVYLEMGQYSRALQYFEKATADKSIIKSEPRLYGRALINRTYSQHKLGSDADLEEYFKEGVCMLDSIGDWQGMARGHFNGAEYFRDRNDTLQALDHANKAMKYALQSKNNKRVLETMELLVSLDPGNAAEYTRAYIKLDDSLQMEERAIRDKFARIRFETDEFIAQNELLARQRQLWIGIAGGVFLLGLSFLIIIIQRVRNQKLRFQQQQQEANQEIFNLMLSQNQKMEEGKQSEQRRISEELHDGVLGEMNGIRMVLLGLNRKVDEDAVNLRSQAIIKLQQVQEEIRTISHELSDASYRKFHNFVVSLQDLLNTMADAAGIAHEMTYDEDIDWDTMSGEMKINLYRIVQESLQNCVKHSGAGNILLNLHGNSTNIIITISDDGRGYNPQSGKKGIGHKNISSRVKKLHGNWEISSRPGNGTTVTIKVPYSETSLDIHSRDHGSGQLQEA